MEETGKVFEYNGLWININGKGNFNSSHNHPGCHMSGVFWIKTPPNCGNISFQSPHSFTHANEMSRYKEEFRARTNSYPAYDFAPREGNILLFPASLIHRVDVCQSNEDRISAITNEVIDGRWLLAAQHLECWSQLWAPHITDELPTLDLLVSMLITAESVLASYS